MIGEYCLWPVHLSTHLILPKTLIQVAVFMSGMQALTNAINLDLPVTSTQRPQMTLSGAR